MPGKSRIDSTGALHHVIMRNIERSTIFRNDFDRNDFLRRLFRYIERHKDSFNLAKLTQYICALINIDKESASQQGRNVPE